MIDSLSGGKDLSIACSSLKEFRALLALVPETIECTNADNKSTKWGLAFGTILYTDQGRFGEPDNIQWNMWSGQRCDLAKDSIYCVKCFQQQDPAVGNTVGVLSKMLSLGRLV